MEPNGSLISFADFGIVGFSNAQATQNGRTVGPQGSTMVDIMQNGQVLTFSLLNGGSVTVRYV